MLTLPLLKVVIALISTVVKIQDPKMRIRIQVSILLVQVMKVIIFCPTHVIVIHSAQAIMVTFVHPTVRALATLP